MSFGVTDRTAEHLFSSGDFRAMFTAVKTQDHARRGADATLRGEGHAALAIARYLEGQRAFRIRRHTHLPDVMPELLRHHGIDPDAALALSIMTGTEGVSILQDLASGSPVQVANVNLRMRDMTWVTLGGMSSWRESEVLLPRLPDVAATSLVGMRLAELATHPVLDGMDIRITGVLDCWEDDRLMEVVTDRHPERED